MIQITMQIHEFFKRNFNHCWIGGKLYKFCRISCLGRCLRSLECLSSSSSSSVVFCCRTGFWHPFSVSLPHAGSGVVRIDPLRFLAGCHNRWLNQALSVLSLSLCFLSAFAVLLTRATFCIFLCYLYVLSLGCSCYIVSTSASDWLERLVSKMTYNVLMGTLNPTHSFTLCLHSSLPLVSHLSAA